MATKTPKFPPKTGKKQTLGAIFGKKPPSFTGSVAKRRRDAPASPTLFPKTGKTRGKR